MLKGNISGWAIRHPMPPIVLFVVLMVAGTAAYFGLDITSNPDIDFPVVTVTVSRPGATPTDLETQVTKKIETAIGNIQGLDHVSSSVIDGSSNTVLEFKVGYNTDRAVNDVRDAVARVRPELPNDIYEPQVVRQNVSGGEILTYNISSPQRSIQDLSWLIDNDITRTLGHVSGVGLVERIGGLDREIRINLDPNRLMAAGITAEEVNDQLRTLNIDLPGGRGTVGLAEQSIRTLGSARTVEQLANAEISIPNGGRVRLKTLGEVVDGTSELRAVSRLNGAPSLGFAISRAPNSSEVTVADGVAKAIEQLRKDYPDVKFDLTLDFVRFTRESFWASIEALGIGTALSVLVVWWFLRDNRATVISSLAMPLSTVPTFLVMKWLGFSLNGVTMLALALVVGILVDDAIVEIENIVRHIRMGKRPYDAAIEAADEIGLAVVATTMTIVAVFVPVSFMPGIPGQFFRSFGITVAVAVLFSLLVARLITPLMAAYLLKPHQKEDHAEPRWMTAYMSILSWCLNNRKWAVLAGVLVFIGSCAIAMSLPSAFQPNTDQGFTTVEVNFPPGTTVEDTDQTYLQATKLLQARPEVKTVWARTSRCCGTSKGFIFVVLTDKGTRMSQKQFEGEMDPVMKQLPGVHIGFQSSGGWGNKDISIYLTSNDGDLLEKTADELRAQMAELPFLGNIATTTAMQRPEILIKPRLDIAAEQGVSVTSIGQVAKIATLGDIDTNVAKFNLSDRQVPIRVQLDPKWRGDMGIIQNLRVRNFSGDLLPLTSVADITMGSSSATIDRFDRARKVAVEADLHGKEFGDAMKIINELPVLKNLPSGISRPSYGASEQMQIMFVGFVVALVTGILLNLAILTLLFRNMFQPFTIMSALPLSFGGAFAALMAARMSVSLPSLIGIIMLMGIVTKNSILLVEYAIMAKRERGMGRFEALMDAGAKRARPIIMTTIAMVAGMAPIAAGMGNDAEFRQPMAVAVIGGLIASTLLSLVFVPVTFTLVDDIQQWLAPKFGWLITAKDGDEVPVPPAHPAE
jgi:hydrophobe/amphiphile efflux-1 (HAE1) family protein